MPVTPLPEALLNKEQALARRLEGYGRVAIAFSGGVDSSYLLALAKDTLGRANVLALTADSPLIARQALAAARRLAHALDVQHDIVEFHPFDYAGIVTNQRDRCYHCKRAVFSELTRLAGGRGFAILLHGANADDRHDYRPGYRAAQELGVKAPLEEIGLTKEEIRRLSRRRGLANWDMPADACLASRIPYGTALSPALLAQVEEAERYLRDTFGFRALRVRHHGYIARIELPVEDWPIIMERKARERLISALREIGFAAVSLDLAGLQSGSLNILLPPESSEHQEGRKICDS